MSRAFSSPKSLPPHPCVRPIFAFHSYPKSLEVSLATEATLFTKEFSLADRVALVTGGHRGIGLEMALTLAEAGARTVYCVDLHKEPSEDWKKVQDFAAKLKHGSKLKYISQDVTDQVSARFYSINTKTSRGGQELIEIGTVVMYRKRCGKSGK